MTDTTTRAIRFDGFGAPDVMTLREIPLPAPTTGEVVLRHTAIGVNFIDTYHRSGLYPITLPSGLGSEAAGVVESIGPGVAHLQVGQRVVYVGGAPLDAYSERRVINAAHLLPIGDDISDAVAAASLLKGLTAWFLLYRSYRVQRGDWVLLHAAAGGVGQLLTQWAHALGANIIALVSSDEKAALAKTNGAQHVLQLQPDALAAKVRDITGGRGVAVVYDSVGKDTFFASLDALAPHGYMVSYGNASGPAPEVAPLELAKRGSLYLTRPVLFDFLQDPKQRDEAVALLFGKLADGTLRVKISQRFALADAAQAHHALAARATIGATLLEP